MFQIPYFNIFLLWLMDDAGELSVDGCGYGF